ncbi:MAG: glycosyltransferase family 39 protein [Chloroflexota bacterium]
MTLARIRTRLQIISHSRRLGFTLLVLLVFALGLGLRLYDLADPPLDFHPTRQLFSALKARGLSYQSAPGVEAWARQMAVRQGRAIATIEPPLIEMLAAWSYRYFGVHIWLARIYSSVFWILGGIALYLLARAMTSPQGGLAALTFYLVLPYGVIASRSFQPDPLMVAAILWAVWAIYRWSLSPGWGRAVAAGLLAGLAIFVKNVAVFPVGAAMASVVVARLGLKQALRSRPAWGMLVLAALPALVYTLWGVFVAGFLGQQFDFRFFPDLWREPTFYVRWYFQMEKVAGFGPLFLAMLGLFLADGKSRRPLLLGLWAGYLLYGLTFAYHITTHDYYQLPLVPIVALSLAPLADAVWDRIIPPLSGFNLLAFTGVILFALAVPVWHVYDALKPDHRPEAQMWADLGGKLGHNASVVSLTDDYGYSLMYWGWQNSTAWLTTGDMTVRQLADRAVDLPERFDKLASTRQFFLVTDFVELARQPELKAKLEKFAVYAQGEGYVIYDLQQPVSP